MAEATAMEAAAPLITVVVPSYNQGRFLAQALDSIFNQELPVEVFVMDGGSSDNSIDIIRHFEQKLAGWRSHPDDGQGAAINEGVALGSAPFVCWLNSDDLLLPSGLATMLDKLLKTDAPAVYGNCWNITVQGKKALPYLTLPFNEYLLANYCFISQPATLVKRKVWQAIGGIDENLQLAMDYDLWWRIYKYAGKLAHTKSFVAANRMHADTKTHNSVNAHYAESIDVVKKHYGNVPIKWKWMLPVMRGVRQATKWWRAR